MSTFPRSPAVRRKHRTYRFHLPILSQKSSCYPLLPPGGNGMLPCLLRQKHRNTISGASPKCALSGQYLCHAGSSIPEAMECFRPVRAGKYSWRSPVFFEPVLIGRTIIIILRAATLRRSSEYLVPYLPPRAVSQNQR